MVKSRNQFFIENSRVVNGACANCCATAFVDFSSRSNLHIVVGVGGIERSPSATVQPRVKRNPFGGKMNSKLTLLGTCILLTAGSIHAADQTQVGAGNSVAEKIAAGSQLVQSAKLRLIINAQGIQNSRLRSMTLDAIANPSTCVTHRVRD
jgi:hypothetical protein